jgi:hypothetical protein
MSEPENLVLMLLRQIREEMATEKDLGVVKDDVAGLKAELKNDIADVSSEVKSLRADVASDFMTMEKRLGDRISHLNRAVMEYHSSTIGHGLLYTEIEERLRRVEQHLKLSPTESH